MMMSNALQQARILYQTPTALVMQTTAGVFGKFADGDLYGEFNVGLHVADEPSDVLVRRAALLDYLNRFGDVYAINWLNQVHGDALVNVGDQVSLMAPSADALMTHQAGRALAIMTADCVPVAIISHDKQAPIACIHAGWQGLVQGVIAKTVSRLRQTHADTQFFAVIGAHISQNCYEITHELADSIIAQIHDSQLTLLNDHKLYASIIKNGSSEGKCSIDLTQLTKLELEKLGLTVFNDVMPCTYQDAQYYSYRAQTHAKKSATGRMAMVVVKLA
ncbi:polyphenol oxidase family protein [Moraxella sp. Tifton1]|uniref:polyphenol oxidase family protein n=1 Tax=Moraxella oculi TaxID=2940516 RepID=UPI0020131C4A|nr:polyphenol oxidase family protein [Moraxella sp. Tifton1]MCL1622833.1 polyphenol oxidase family protein [Moraxella sp. Tifton1]